MGACSLSGVWGPPYHRASQFSHLWPHNLENGWEERRWQEVWGWLASSISRAQRGHAVTSFHSYNYLKMSALIIPVYGWENWVHRHYVICSRPAIKFRLGFEAVSGHTPKLPWNKEQMKNVCESTVETLFSDKCSKGGLLQLPTSDKLLNRAGWNFNSMSQTCWEEVIQ